LEPCLLLLLRREASHGYNLLSELESFGFDPESMDPSLVYRALREMEASGWVESHWDEDSLGPKRRVYTLTDEGEEHLERWAQDLRRTRDEIDALLERFENPPRGPTEG
jgi:poly-beta-hydroxybutyrate-responsive repressor